MNDFVKYYSKNNLITGRKFREINRLYDLSPEELLRKYNEAFLSIFKKAIRHSEFYKKFYAEHGINLNSIKDITDIQKLPVINRQLIKDRVNEIYNGFDFLKVKGLTSGTTGTPLTVYRTPVNIAYEQAYIRHYRQMYGFRLGQPLLSIRGVLGKSVTHEFYKKANILYISSPNINAGTIEFYYDLIREFKPVAIEAFPSYLNKFCVELEKKGLPLEIPNAFTSSEMLYQHQRERIEPYLNTKVHDWYGNVERTIALAQDAQNNYYPLPLYSINEFEPNRVITTALINRNFPLIRYAVNDVVLVEGGDFMKNLVNPKVIRIEGRTGDNVDLKDGSVVGCMDHAFKGVSHIEMAQIHQYHVQDPIEIKIVSSSDFTKDDENQLRANLLRMLGNDMELKFTYCNREDLTYSASNKFNLIIKRRPGS